MTINDFIENSARQQFFPILSGLTMNIIGDSYFAGEGLDPLRQVWPALLAKKYGMTFSNKGIGGSTMSNFGKPTAEKNPNPMVDRYHTMPDSDPDIVLLEGGRNDYNYCTPIGADGDTTTKTYKGAMRTLIEGVRAKFPRAVLICITAWRTDQKKEVEGVTYDCNAYPAAMRDVCAQMGVPCIYAADPNLIPVRMFEDAFRTIYSLTPADHSHMNEAGMRMVMPHFEREIARIYCEAKGLPFENLPQA